VRPGAALERRMAELSAREVPFVRATVVRARRPTSAHPGDSALVFADGRMEGFVGGVCAEATVRLQALRALHSGESLLLRISPLPRRETEPGAARDPRDPRREADAEAPARASGPRSGSGSFPDPDPGPGREPEIVDGALVVANPCLSGGELEIFLEPLRPAPIVLVLGDTPIGRALLALGAGLEYDIRAVPAGGVRPASLDAATAVVVASHGRDEEALLTPAARSEAPYVALVASGRRGAAVVEGLDLTEEQRARVRTPAGLWIGARTPGEVAVSILAELIAVRRGVRPRTGDAPHDDAGDASCAEAGASPEPLTAVDPVCGMTVAAVPGTPHSDAGGVRRWFCGPDCRSAFEAGTAGHPEAS
jgi:xanthine dehydrogenase accessory factor